MMSLVDLNFLNLSPPHGSRLARRSDSMAHKISPPSVAGALFRAKEQG
jgi:hypothetical protein